MTDKQAVDYREKLLRAAKVLKAYLKEGATTSSVAEEFGINHKTVRKYIYDKELINDIFGIRGQEVRKLLEQKIDDNKHKRNNNSSVSKRK